MGHGPVVYRRLAVRVEDVVGCVASLQVGAVLQPILADDVPQRPDAGHPGFQVFIRLDEAARVGFDARGGHLQQVRVGYAAGGHEQGVGGHLDCTSIHGDFQGDLIPTGRGAGDLGVQQQIELALIHLGKPSGHIVILFPEQQLPPMDQGYLGSQGAEEVGHLGCDETAAHDSQAPRLFRQAKGLVGGDVWDIRQAWNIRHGWPGARGDQDGFGVDLFPVHFQDFVAHEPAGALEHGNV